MIVTATTDCYILVAEFRTAADIGKCENCSIRLSGTYTVEDIGTLAFPECRYYCGD